MKKTQPFIQFQSGQSQAGMTLIEIMIAIAISSIVILASVSIGNMSTNLQSQNNLSFQADMLRRNMVSLVLSDSAWQKTVTGPLNSGMSCLQSGPPTPGPCGAPYTGPGAARTINGIYDGTGNLVYSVSGTAGFNNDGSKCTTGTPSSPCPLTFKVQWTPLCVTPPSCVQPQVKVEIIANYNNPTGATALGQHQMVFNEANYSATIYR